MPELTSLTTRMSAGDSKTFLYPRILNLQRSGGCVNSSLDMSKLEKVVLSSSAFKYRTSLVKEGASQHRASLVDIGALERYFE